MCGASGWRTLFGDVAKDFLGFGFGEPIGLPKSLDDPSDRREGSQLELLFLQLGGAALFAVEDDENISDLGAFSSQ